MTPANSSTVRLSASRPNTAIRLPQIQPSARHSRAPLVTILSSACGGGHAMVAQAVQDALGAMRPNWHVDTIDFLERFVGERFSHYVSSAYWHSARRAPMLYDLFYRTSAHVGEDSWVRAQVSSIGRDRLREYLHWASPDLVVSTHPIPAGALSALKLSGLARPASATVITDYVVHGEWLHRGTDLYIVGNAAVRGGLLDAGIRGDRVVASGIPVRPEFAHEDLPRTPERSVLVMVGALGMLRDAHRLCEALTAVAPRTIVICGSDEGLRQSLLALPAARDGRLSVRGFVEDVWRPMAEAQLLVTKPGGVTTSEALAIGLPMVLCGAIPGQEEGNQTFLVAAGAATAPGGIRQVREEVARLLRSPGELAAMGGRAAALGHPQAAHDAASTLVSLVEHAHFAAEHEAASDAPFH